MSQRNKCFWSGIAILFLLGATSAESPFAGYEGIIRHDREFQKYLALGSQAEFHSFGRYSESIDSEDFAGGVLIAPTWILTAAHFVQETSFWRFGDTFYKTKKIVYHPDLVPGSEENQWTGNDLALIQLEEAVTDVIPAKRYYDNQELGMEVTKIGYGYIGNGHSGMDSPKKQARLGGKNIIDGIGGHFENREFSNKVLVCDFDSPETEEFNQFGSSKPLDLEIGGSKGDSGGGVFMKVNGETILVGIVSGALNRELKYGAVMALARVSTSNAWIDSVISER